MSSYLKSFLVMLLLALSFATVAQQPLDTLDFLKNNPNVYSLVVVKNNKLLYRKYFNAHPDTELFNDQSLTKNVMSLLIGIAIDKGYIRSADEKISDFFPELLTQPDERKRGITIRQIMNQVSGLYHEDLKHLNKFLALSNPSEYVLAEPLAAEPGTIWHYNNAATHLLSVILTKAAKMPTQEFARRYLFEPLDIKNEQWMKMRDGYDDGSGLMSVRLSTGDLVKIGQLIISDGKIKDRQTVPVLWIREILNPSITYSSYWGFPHSTYSLCFYHFTYEGKTVTYGMGWGGQFMVMIPDYKAVIAINQSVDNKNALERSDAFISTVFPVIFKMLSNDE